MKKVYSLLTMAVIVAMSLTMTSCDGDDYIDMDEDYGLDDEGEWIDTEDDDYEEAKHRKVESIKMIEARNNKKFEKVTRITHKSLTKKTQTRMKKQTSKWRFRS